MTADETDYKGICVIAGLIGAHILAAIYDGDYLKFVLGADIGLAFTFFGIQYGAQVKS